MLPLAGQAQSGKKDGQPGVLSRKADFWIGHPARSNAMPFLQVSAGAEVLVQDQEDEYYVVLYRNLRGYLPRHAVKMENAAVEKTPSSPEKGRPEVVNTKPAPAPAPASGLHTVSKETSLRAGPDSKARVLVRLPEGGQVKVLEDSGHWWWKVAYEGRTGWAKAALLKR